MSESASTDRDDAIRPPSASSTLVKICGLTRVDEALATAEAGADWIGLNFHPASPRFIDSEIASEIIACLPKTTSAVGLFVDLPADVVADRAKRLGLRIIQLHGNEPAEALLELADFTIVRAFRIEDSRSVERMIAHLERARQLGRLPDAVLIDAHVRGQPGGTGVLIADTLLREIPPLPRLILAGGLNPENVSERMQIARPWMVDVSSGVESTPGRKSPERVGAFIRAVRHFNHA